MRKTICVVLYNIRSVHNVASIFRTADAAGVERILLCGITPAPLDRFGKVRRDFHKVALGAERSVPWERVPRTASAIDRLRREGFRVVAVEQARRAVPYFRFRPSPRMEKIAVVLGNEVRGVPASLVRRADATLEIPMRGKKESLNVSVAAGIILFYLRYNA